MAMAQSTVRGFFHSKWWIFPSFFLFEIHGYPTIPVRYVNVYLRGSSSIFQNGFSYAFPMAFPIKTSIFLCFSYGFPMVFSHISLEILVNFLAPPAPATNFTTCCQEGVSSAVSSVPGAAIFSQRASPMTFCVYIYIIMYKIYNII